MQGHISSPGLLGVSAGIFTGICVSFVATPVELIKCRQQVSQTKRLGISELLMTVLRKDGPTGMMRGFTTTFLRSTTGNAAAFGAYETLIANGVPVVVSGGVAGLCFWTIGYPADVLKSNIQTAKSNEGLLQRIKLVYQKRQWSTFGRGYSAVLLRAFPSNAAAFWTYEFCAGFARQNTGEA